MKNELLAPNGKPSNLTPEQYKLVRTPAFLNWFGNWINDPANASKVVDENGEPQVCYHGTFSENLNVFDESKISRNTGNEGHYGYGFYFSFSKVEASTYTYATNPIILECFLDIKNPFLSSNINHLEKYAKDYGYYEEKKPVAIDSDWLESQLKKYKDPKPYLLYKSIKENGYEKGWKLFLDENKVDWDNETFDYNRISDWFEYDSSLEQFSKENEKENYNYEIPEHILEDLSEQLNIPVSKIKTIKQYTSGNYPTLLYMMDLGNRSRSLTNEIKKDGFDGIIAGSEIVLFKPNQIKLADGTNTTFDSSNNDIRFEYGGRTIAQTPAPKKDQIYGSDLNKNSSSKDLLSAKLIKFDEKTLSAVKNKVQKHNEQYPDKKINLSSAKAVVRRGMGAYSKSHRPTISGRKPNSRVAWGLARLNAFTYKIVNGKSKSGKYSQDDDLIEELGFKVANYKNGGEMKKDIRCINCGWEWNKRDSELWDMYICHNCGFDNTTFYTPVVVNNFKKGGNLENTKPHYLKMFLGK